MPKGETLHGMRALAHPLRVRILTSLARRPMSAAELARALDDSQPNVSYHLRRLLDAGMLEIAEEVPIRGGVAKRYRHNPGGARATSSTVTDAELCVDAALWRDTVDRVRELGERLRRAAVAPDTPGAVRVGVSIALVELDAP